MKGVLRMAGAAVDEVSRVGVTCESPRRDEARNARTVDVHPPGARSNRGDDVLAGVFPASDPPSSPPGAAKPAPTAVLTEAAPLTFLVSYVPDEREMYGEALKMAGFDVRTFADPVEAFDAAVADQPRVVVTRILQPGFDVDGLELARRIRRHLRTHGAAVLVITSLNAKTYRAAAVEAGCDCLLTLPCVPDELVHQIRRSIVSRSEGEQHVAAARSRAALRGD